MTAVFALCKMSALWYAKHSALRGRNRLHVWKSDDDGDATRRRAEQTALFIPFSPFLSHFHPFYPPSPFPHPSSAIHFLPVSSPLWVSGYFPISTRLPGPILGFPGDRGTSGYFWLWKMVVTNWFDIWWNVCNVSLFFFLSSPLSPTTATATLLQPLATRSDEQERLLYRAFIYVLYGSRLIWGMCLCQRRLRSHCKPLRGVVPGNLNYYWTVWCSPRRGGSSVYQCIPIGLITVDYMANTQNTPT